MTLPVYPHYIIQILSDSFYNYLRNKHLYHLLNIIKTTLSLRKE